MKTITTALFISLLFSVKAYAAEEEDRQAESKKLHDTDLTFTLKEQRNVNPLLENAIKTGSADMVAKLLEAKADPNLKYVCETTVSTNLADLLEKMGVIKTQNAK